MDGILNSNLIESTQGFIDIHNVYIIFVFIFVFFWILTIIWTAKDISARTDNGFLQIISIILSVIPVVGILIYLVIRPISLPIGIKRDRTTQGKSILETNAVCRYCGVLNPRDFKCCIKCGTKLETKCKECGKEYPYNYLYCPICGAPNLKQNLNKKNN